MKFTNIIATPERQDVLDSCGIKWSFDDELNFIFNNIEEYHRAIIVMINALVLTRKEIK